MTDEQLYTVERFATKEEWLAVRGIGGTSAGIIMGVNPWKTKLELYNELVNPGERKDEDTASKMFGRAAEPLLRDLWWLNHPEMVMVAPKGYEMYRSTEYHWQTATIDGTVIDEEGRKGVWECKTHEMRGPADEEEWAVSIPLQYLWQVIHYLYVLNDYEFIEVCSALNYFEGTGESRRLAKTVVRYDHIERSDITPHLKLLGENEKAFWESVEKQIPPDGVITF